MQNNLKFAEIVLDWVMKNWQYSAIFDLWKQQIYINILKGTRGRLEKNMIIRIWKVRKSLWEEVAYKKKILK